MQVDTECGESAAHKGIWLLELLKVCEGVEDHTAQGWSWSCSSGPGVHPLFQNIHPSEGIAEFLI